MTDHWLVILTPDQGYLGRCYVTLRDHKVNLSELSQIEWGEYADIVNRIELACKKALGATLFNWSCLLNNAYQVKPYLPHVHWHFRPRYDSVKTIRDHTFQDPAFGFHYDRNQRQQVDQSLYDEISTKIKEFL